MSKLEPPSDAPQPEWPIWLDPEDDPLVLRNMAKVGYVLDEAGCDFLLNLAKNIELDFAAHSKAELPTDAVQPVAWLWSDQDQPRYDFEPDWQVARYHTNVPKDATHVRPLVDAHPEDTQPKEVMDSEEFERHTEKIVATHMFNLKPLPTDAAQPSDKAKLAFIKAHSAIDDGWIASDKWEKALIAGLRAAYAIDAHPEDAPGGLGLESISDLAAFHSHRWRDQNNAYWLGRLMQEVGELVSVLVDDHPDTIEHELEQIGSIAVNWLNRLATKGE